MKVVLTHAYFIQEDEKEQAIMRPYPPLGILYLSAYLEELNIGHTVFDTTFRRKQELYDYLLEEQPGVIGIYANLMTKVNLIELVHFIKAAALPTKIILGGPDVTYNTIDYLNNGADFLVIGEGEQTFSELILAIKDNKKTFNDIHGIAFLDESGKEVKTPARLKIKSIDELPMPNRSAIDLHQYLAVWKKHHGQSAVNVSTQRGCPYTCKWCSTAVYGQSYRRQSPEKVVQELTAIEKQYQPDTIWFVDDVFTVSHKWLKAFVDELNKSKLKIKFECISRADRMNDEVIALLKEAGCFRVWIGAESGSQKIIDAMDRRVSVDKVREIIQSTQAAGMEAGTFIMVGYPGETRDDIYETIHHLKVSDPDYFTVTVAYPIKGTDLFNEVEDKQTKQLDWSTTTDRDRDFKRTYRRKYYDMATAKMIHEVNFFKRKNKVGWDLRTIKLKMKSTLYGFAMNVFSL